MMPAINVCGVTSNAGFQMSAPSGATWDVPTWVTSRALRCSIGIAAPVSVAIGGADASGAFKKDDKGGWQGVVTGLRDGDNQVTAKAGGREATLTLKNHAINATLGNVGRTVFYTAPFDAEPVDQVEVEIGEIVGGCESRRRGALAEARMHRRDDAPEARERIRGRPRNRIGPLAARQGAP